MAGREQLEGKRSQVCGGCSRIFLARSAKETIYMRGRVVVASSLCPYVRRALSLTLMAKSQAPLMLLLAMSP
jgi:hypothetical protein